MEKDQVKKIFDNSAESYDKTWEKLAPINDSLHLLMGTILTKLPKNAKILCVGAGTGAEIIYLALKFPFWQFTAVDPSAAMLNVCRRRLRELGIEDRCEFHADYLENLSLPDDYDAATSILVSQFINEKESRIGFFRNIAAKMNQKGILISADLSGDINSAKYENILDVWGRMMVQGEVHSQSIENIRQSHKSGISFLAPEKVADIIESAGFEKPVQFIQMAFIHGWFCQKKNMKQQVDNQILFTDKEAFRAWLSENHSINDGIWLIFGKKKGPKTLSPDEAVEEALCFGWIDSQMKSIDEKTYIEYFCPRRKNSKWSERNKATVSSLEMQGRMTDYGRIKVEEAKKNGKWNSHASHTVSEEQIADFSHKIEGIEPAYSNFMAMSFSVRKTYTLWYLDAKSEQTKINRLSKIVERLHKNLKPM